VNIVELALRVVEQYRSATSRQISLETKQPAIAGTWDEDRLEQVLNNLVSNAIHYSPANTPVIMSIADQADEVIVSVRDQGQGISEKDQAHIFDRFYRVHNKETSNVDGLGLGLYIASKLIIQHGGRMWLESKLGKGSVFSFSLPLKK
ncbi:MAG TPA: ATP-binding protein, partial [Ktedonobacteraceae bacterium]|nr:ATP-binding protein [Ktedonobacteraceae bacterium]